MNLRICYLVISVQIAVIVFLCIWIGMGWGSKSKPQTDNDVMNSNSAIENIMSRTSVRSYTDEPVSKSDMETLLKAAMAAPTAGNKQPWRFVIIQKRSTLDSIATNFNSMKMAAHAPLAIVVCGDTTSTFDGEGVGYWIQDTSAATENLLLAAHGLGLGAVWCGITPITERMEQLSQMLNLPPNILPLNVVVIGHPAGMQTPKDKWKPEYIHYEKWD